MIENVHRMKNEKLPSQWPPDFFKKLHEDHILAQKGHRADLFLIFFKVICPSESGKKCLKVPWLVSKGVMTTCSECPRIFANDSEGPYDFSWHEL